ncbi:muconolactone delta-isomerase [Candidatus Gracilibacteria bacterium]|nr:muconolactone delta-isomerase [Candidatus Gracilibacteria bacterium]
MLFHAQVVVHFPPTIDPALQAELIAHEIERGVELMQAGKLVHIWRIVGKTANYSLWKVDSHAELHTLLTSLPLFPYLEIALTPLCEHPVALQAATIER